MNSQRSLENAIKNYCLKCAGSWQNVVLCADGSSCPLYRFRLGEDKQRVWRKNGAKR